MEVGAVQTGPNGMRTADLQPKELTVKLRVPLGERPVIDRGSGLRLRQDGPDPGGPACPPFRELSDFEQLTRERESLGLPSDPATVRARLANRGEPTPAERRYLESRAELTPTRAVEHYLLVHRDEYGGDVIDGLFPETPRIVYRFTRNIEQHEAALKRLVRHPDRVSTALVGFTVRQLLLLDDQIRRDAHLHNTFFDGYGDAGFYLKRTEWNTREGVVRLEVVTTRADAAAYFANRYGPLIRVDVVGDRDECADWY